MASWESTWKVKTLAWRICTRNTITSCAATMSARRTGRKASDCPWSSPADRARVPASKLDSYSLQVFTIWIYIKIEDLLIFQIICLQKNIQSPELRRRWADVISLTWASAKNAVTLTRPDIRPATRPTWHAPTTLFWPDPTRMSGSTLTSSKCGPTTRPSFTAPTAKKIGSRSTMSFTAAERSYSAVIVATRSQDPSNPIPDPSDWK